MCVCSKTFCLSTLIKLLLRFFLCHYSNLERLQGGRVNHGDWELVPDADAWGEMTPTVSELYSRLYKYHVVTFCGCSLKGKKVFLIATTLSTFLVILPRVKCSRVKYSSHHPNQYLRNLLCHVYKTQQKVSLYCYKSYLCLETIFAFA